jgi:polysaccharide biosynthesis PFTS motif protein
VLGGLAEFARRLVLALSSAVAGIFYGRPREKRAVTLLLGTGAENISYAGSDARFVEYCTRGPIEPLREAQWLIVQAEPPASSANPERFCYARFPLHAAAARMLTTRDVCRLLVDSFATAARWVCLVTRAPINLLLAHDYACLPLIRLLDSQQRIAAVVLTNSVYSIQPLWCRGGRNFATHLVWYSQNTIPVVYADDGIASDLPHYRHLATDASWLWTEEYADYLRRLGVSSRYHVVGPILWHLPEANGSCVARRTGRDPEPIRFAVFDVTPISDETALRIGIIRNYYSPERMMRFLGDVVDVAHDLEVAARRSVTILLKHKRGFGPTHARIYIDFVERLCSENPRLRIVHYQTSLYDILRDSDVSIVIPYSSPAYVSSHLGKPSIFFDPGAELRPTFLPAPGVSFASGRQELLAQVTSSVMAVDSVATATR